ncbi:MAG TPA: hypothetical protein VHB18_08080 [Mycobacteriales bacterium]|nr:hypothetical protein [Mycobacteriales bacterium]
MTPDLDQLSETFAAHESLAPAADAVLARSHEIARSLKRRQWMVRSTSGVALGAAVVVGGVVVPQTLHHNGSHNATVIGTASSGAAPTAASSPAATQDEDWAAYFNAGYTYDDAVQLAKLWNESDGPDAIGNVKAEAGAKLLAGKTLPIPPSGQPATAQDLAMQAFWNAGYDSEDATRLAQIWHETDISQVKVEAGQKLEKGEQLPIQPSGGNEGVPPATNADVAAAQAFFDAGYTYDDALQLAGIWNVGTYQAKVAGGHQLEKGATLPISPSGHPASADQRALEAYFAAGYGYDNAVALGRIWHETDVSQVKVEAGRKLENGEKLPVAP